MTELVKQIEAKRFTHWQLLTTVSAATLAVAFYMNSPVFASDDEGSQPTVWIELGGLFSQQKDDQKVFSPVFPDSPSRPSIFSPSEPFEHAPRSSFDETGKLSIEPGGTDLVFSAAVRYGRSQNKKNVHQQTNPNPLVKYHYGTYPNASGVVARRLYHNTQFPSAARFANTSAQISEQHLVLDFQAGKDVGLGLFGSRGGSSVVSVGVRFAQFISKANIAIKSNPDWHFHYKYFSAAKNYGFLSSKFATGQIYHSNQASFRATRSFHGIGPSLSWNASLPVLGHHDSEVSVDWGVNVALLFGRQRTKIQHQTTGSYHGAKYDPAQRVIVYHPTPVNVSRSHSVTVPNVGGFAGLSFHYTNAKISLGYRADFFFGAMDNGIDRKTSEDRGFYGPYASIGIGL